MSCTKVSVIIPIYNVGKYLHTTLGSLAAQDMQEAEFICVDDCSTDSSREIIDEYAAKDSRFKKIYLEENSSALIARQRGIMSSKGEYIMFLDGDDYFESDACSKAYAAICEKDVDILQFPLKWLVQDESASPSEEYVSKFERTEDFVTRAPHADLLKLQFSERKLTFNIFNKIIRRDVCLRACNDMSDERLDNGDDAYVSFLMTYHSSSFAGISGQPLCCHYHGRGINGGASLSLQEFKALCEPHKITKALLSFLDKKENSSELHALAKNMERDILNNVSHILCTALAKDERPAGYDLMCSVWGPAKVVASLADVFWNNKTCVLESLYGSKLLARRPKKIRTIAMYYHHITIGGIERVMGSLSTMWQNMGYRLVLITDSAPDEGDMPMAPGIKRVVINEGRDLEKESYADRSRLLAKALIENEIDAVDYNAWVSPFMEWDTLLIKSLDVAFIYHVHNIFTYDAGYRTLLSDRLLAARFMDCVVNLMKVDSLLLSCYNPNNHQINNPPFYDDPIALPQAHLGSKTVLWLARISEQKNPVDAIKVFAAVKKKVPDATLIMVGSGPDHLEKEVHDAITQYDLEDSVIMPGYSTNVSEYYTEASVLIHTASFEGFCLVYLEAGLHGLPIVTYSMEYLELIRDCRSMISIPMGDTDAMAEEVIKLLNDAALRKNTGANTRREMLDFINTDISGEWKKVFDSIENGTGAGYADDDTRIMINTLFDFYNQHVNKHNDQLTDMKAWVRELEKARDYHYENYLRLQSESQDHAAVLENEISKRDDQISALKSWIHSLEQNLRHSEEHASALETELTSRDSSIRDLKQWIDTLENNLRHSEEHASALETELTSRDSSIRDLKQWIDTLETEISSRDGVIAELRQWISSLENNLKYSNEHSAALETEIASRDGIIAELKQWTSSLENNLKYIEEHTSALETELSNRENIIKELKSWISSLEETKDYYVSRDANLEGQIKNLTERAASLTASSASLAADVESLTRRNQELADELNRRDTGSWALKRLLKAVKNKLGLSGRK